MKYIIILFLVMSFISVVMTSYDKLAAKTHRRRIPENTLLILGLLGGATAMFATMCLIRHKTRHMKFMLILPLMSALHIALIFYLHFNIA
ncbi:MAG: DUF1294 domain-containing protein [Clostridia bacterium]|nr:DUF1294 domain-containing protein [Clostridia bacterium]